MQASYRAIGDYTVAALIVWFLAAAIAGHTADLPGLFIVVPFAGFGAAYFGSRRLRAFALSISLPLMVGAHAWRYVGIGFVIA